MKKINLQKKNSFSSFSFRRVNIDERMYTATFWYQTLLSSRYPAPYYVI